MTRFFLLAIILLLVFTTAGCGTDESPNSYKIGVLISNTGGASPLGSSGYKALQLLEKQINDNGGINGIPLELIIADDESNPDKAIAEVQRLINDENVLAILGSTTSGISLAMKGIASDNSVPMISFAASAKLVDPNDPLTKWVFKTAHTDEHAVRKMYTYLQKQEFSKIGIIHDSNAYGEGGRLTLENLADEYGIEVKEVTSYNSGDPDMTVQLVKLREAEPDIIVMMGLTNEMVTIAMNKKSLGLKIPIMGSHGIASDALPKLAGEAVNGIIAPTSKLLFPEKITEEDPQYQVISTFSKDFKTEYGSLPTNFTSPVYDAFAIIVNVLENGATDREAIRDYLEQNINGFVGTTGIFNMTAEDHVGLHHDDMVIAQIVNGEWEIIE